MRKIALGAVLLTTAFAPGVAGAAGLSHRDIMRGARAYAKSFDNTPATIACRQNHCIIVQDQNGGDWKNWTITYKVTVRRIGPHRIRVSNPFFKPDITICG